MGLKNLRDLFGFGTFEGAKNISFNQLFIIMANLRSMLLMRHVLTHILFILQFVVCHLPSLINLVFEQCDRPEVNIVTF